MRQPPRVIYKGSPKSHSWVRWSVFRVKRRNNSTNVRFVGDTGCLSGDTIVNINRGGASRKYKLSDLYNKYQKNYKSKSGRYFDLNIPSRIRCFNGKDIKLHKIKDIVYSGKKEVFELKLKNGYLIKATADHKIMTNHGWKELQDIELDDLIMCDNLIAYPKNRKRIKLRDIELSVGKNHPYNIKLNGQIPVHRLIFEAYDNKLKFIEYLDILLNEPEQCKNLKFINPQEFVIHHIDGNHYNNTIINLEKINASEHRSKHNNYSNFSQGDPKFIEWESVGKKQIEDTYDICCDEPYHNFVANNIIVHNSGKSWSALAFCEMCSKLMNKVFTINDVYFSIRDVLDEIADNAPPRGRVFLIDEQQVDANAKDHQSKRAKAYSILLSTVRSKGYVIVTTLPFSDMELKSVRRFFHVEVETHGANYSTSTVRCTPRYLEYSRAKSEKVYRKRLIITYTDINTGIVCNKKLSFWDIPKASPELIDDYELKKAIFQHKLYKRLSKELSKDEGDDEEVTPKAAAGDIVEGTLTEYQRGILKHMRNGTKMQKDISLKLAEEGFTSTPQKVSQNIKWMRNKGVVIIR